MLDPSPLPNWVLKADGRVEPFDGDRISRALFAATEGVGQPNPFLARELTDGVLHFLAADGAVEPIPAGDVVDATIKVVRELGHPLLARAYQEMCATAVPVVEADERPWQTDEWPPDLQAAERDGLLRLFDADSLPMVAGMVLPPAEGGWIEAIAAARDRVGQFVAIDGPEYLLPTPAAVTYWARALHDAVKASGFRVFVNLNSAEPPAWAVAEGGPLFGPPRIEDAFRRNGVAEAIANELLKASESAIRVDWHLSDRDFQPRHRDRLISLGRSVAGNNASITFVTDRPRRLITLGDGLSRDDPVVLAAVGVGLSRLLEIVQSGTAPTADAVLARLGGLARLALSAGYVRRGMIRDYGPPGASAGFLLDRARLVVIPLGLNDVVQSVTAQHWTAGQGLEFARDILLGLNAAMLRDATRVPAVIGGPAPMEEPIDFRRDADFSPRQQLRAAATIHSAIGSGTALINLPALPSPRPEEIADLVEFAWRLPGLDRFAFSRPKPHLRQMTAGW